jgi:hypothetical protein
MRTSDYRLNASQICSAAGLDKAERDSVLRRLKSRCKVEKEKRSIWVPFTDGVLLCRALGLADDMEQLLSRAPAAVAVPKDQDNYMLEHRQRQRALLAQKAQTATYALAPPAPEECQILQCHNELIAYAPSTRTINATHLAKTGGVSKRRLATFLAGCPDLQRHMLTATKHRTLNGVWIKVEDAPRLCRHFNLGDDLISLAQGLLENWEGPQADAADATTAADGGRPREAVSVEPTDEGAYDPSSYVEAPGQPGTGSVADSVPPGPGADPSNTGQFVWSRGIMSDRLRPIGLQNSGYHAASFNAVPRGVHDIQDIQVSAATSHGQAAVGVPTTSYCHSEHPIGCPAGDGLHAETDSVALNPGQLPGLNDSYGSRFTEASYKNGSYLALGNRSYMQLLE